MRKTLVIFAVLLLAGAAVSVFDELGRAEENSPNACYAEDIKVKKGSTFAVPIILENSDSLIAFQLPIYYRSEDIDLVCDSVSFAGTRLAGESTVFFLIEPVGKVVFFAYMSLNQIDPTRSLLVPGKGPIGMVWFTAGKDIKSGAVTLDSGPHAYFPHEWIDYSYHFWVRTDSPEITADVDCQYKQSKITVK